jgi:hypothetical protein
MQQDAHVALSMVTGGRTGYLNNYLVISGRARVTEGETPELLHQLAQIYVGPETKFPADNSPPGYITHIQVERIHGVGAWQTQN